MPPLITLEVNSRAPYERLPSDARATSASDDDDSVLDIDNGEENGQLKRVKKWWNYIPLCLLVILLVAPQYNILVLLTSYYLKIHYSPFLFMSHVFIIYAFTFLSFCSLIVLIVRDPGAIKIGEEANTLDQEIEDENEETNILDALRMKPVSSQPRDDDFNAPHKWCRKCWAPKPERTHHCSVCGRCVLKMDHHCPWLASKCVGYWTYTAFIHFLFCITLLASYVGFVAGRIVYVAFLNPFLVDERTALHGLFLSLYGAIFSLSIGSFMIWHVYLASTNQTTIENISPFLLLRYLPTQSNITNTIASTPGQASNSLESTVMSQGDANYQNSLSTRPDSTLTNTHTRQRKAFTATPREHQLSSEQRRHVRYAHGRIRLYDVGFRDNWGQIAGIGSRGWRGWFYRLLCGGGGSGDGKTFPRNPRAEGMLARLAAELYLVVVFSSLFLRTGLWTLPDLLSSWTA